MTGTNLSSAQNSNSSSKGNFKNISKPSATQNGELGSRPSQSSGLKYRELKSGDSFSDFLLRQGFTVGQLTSIAHKFNLKQLNHLNVSRFYRDESDLKMGKVAFRFFLQMEDFSLQIWRGSNQKVGYVKAPENFRIETESRKGKISGSLFSTIEKFYGDDYLARRFMDAYLLDFNLGRILQRGAPYRITYEKKFLGRQFIKFGEVLQTQLEINGTNYSRSFIKLPGGGTFVKLDSAPPRPFFSPVNYFKVSSLYQPNRLHPIKRVRQPHYGIDFELPPGRPVFVAYAGRVIRSGKQRGAGNFVVVKHPNGFESYYNHLLNIDPSIRPGVYLENGDTIGQVGCTGYCTKPHLHFALKRGSAWVDPAKWLRSYSFEHQNQVVRILATMGATKRPTSL